MQKLAATEAAEETKIRSPPTDTQTSSAVNPKTSLGNAEQKRHSDEHSATNRFPQYY